ncbi:hypothetical protein ONS95_012912 [Cadophora gregata]|uniref:uncharacterized protein n=1 Tax=Cadophora gregata TaxID=51156 RepID=UPI0026DB5CDF|nr:uncharacterized protein ONS95_012912 [Cadophora gregata]KAK0101104.1 hypothetical protein ONS96_006331 [Cadophora gregata f. sp. sojae]KAK0115864.1 hypothetical protein ONS95_012912 [Cadophora gregata]
MSNMNSTSISPSTSAASTMTSSASTNNADMKPDKSTLFPNMPLELREMIWTQACRVERVVDIWVKVVGGSAGKNFFDTIRVRRAVNYKSHAKLPSVLHTSKEARQIGLKHYTMVLGSKYTNSYRGTKIEFSTPARIYFNCEYDILCPIFASWEAEYQFMKDVSTPEVFPKIRRIAFCVMTSFRSYWAQLGNLPDLEVSVYPNFYVPKIFSLNGFNRVDDFHMELVDFDEKMDYHQYETAGYAPAWEQMLAAKRFIQREFNESSWRFCNCGKEVENCHDPSHRLIDLPITFKNLKATVTDREQA